MLPFAQAFNLLVDFHKAHFSAVKHTNSVVLLPYWLVE
jgi:hypothetical protein